MQGASIALERISHPVWSRTNVKEQNSYAHCKKFTILTLKRCFALAFAHCSKQSGAMLAVSFVLLLLTYVASSGKPILP